MKSFYLVIFVGVCLFSFTTGKCQESKQKLYRIHTEDISQLRNIEKQGVTVLTIQPEGSMDILAYPEQIPNLQVGEATIEFIANSFRELYDNQPQAKTGPKYHTYQEMVDELQAIHTAHPNITALDTIGYSVLGRMILCLKISDNPAEDEDEPPVLMVGNHHGNEILSVEATMYQINYLINNYGTQAEVTDWINGMEIWYVPMLNPDGHEALRRTNENGVDLNRNYSFGFTAEGNHGPAAFSEPETRAIRDLVAKYPPIMSLTYHTSGRLVLYPWTHTNEAAPDSAALIYIGTKVAESIQFLNGGRTEHYTLRQGGRWYFTAGEYCDYFYRNFNCMVFTIEMWTSQAPDASVIPQVVERNLNGMITLFRQVHKAGMTGLITDRTTLKPVKASIRVPAIDDQGKVLPVYSDSAFGRYYRYFEPGTYTIEISAPGYRTQYQDVSILEDGLTVLPIQLDRGPMIQVADMDLVDNSSGKTDGNGDKRINLGETLGLVIQLENTNPIDANETFIKVTSPTPLVEFLSDTLHFGTVAGNSSKISQDTILFRISPLCEDGQILIFNLDISDSEGLGWLEEIQFETFTPNMKISSIDIDDSNGNNNGVLDNGESAIVELRLINTGRQPIHQAEVTLSTANPFFQVIQDTDHTDSIGIQSTWPFHFEVSVAQSTPVAYIAGFLADLTTIEGYSPTLPLKLHNVSGFYDDFENGTNGWRHNAYATASNQHDDWQLGKPTGMGSGDPDSAYSGSNCWGTDMGWYEYDGTNWDGNYQSNVYNYLRSPVIDCTNFSGVGLKFMRLLNIRNNDYGRIKVNGENVWQSPIRGSYDMEWTEQIIDISAIADKNPSVTITFELESDGSGNLGGWNIDDVIVANGLFAGSSGIDFTTTATTQLFDCYPNPFETSTTITYSIANPTHADVIVFDTFGRMVCKLWSGFQPAGTYRLTWDGARLDGTLFEPGIYFYQLVTPDRTETKRMVFMR